MLAAIYWGQSDARFILSKALGECEPGPRNGEHHHQTKQPGLLGCPLEPRKAGEGPSVEAKTQVLLH